MVYIDDILSFATTTEEGLEKLRKIEKALRSAELTIR